MGKSSSPVIGVATPVNGAAMAAAAASAGSTMPIKACELVNPTREPCCHTPRTATAAVPIAVNAASGVGAIDGAGRKNRHDMIVKNTRVSRVPAHEPGSVAVTPSITLTATITHQITGQTRPHHRDTVIRRPTQRVP